MKSLLVAIVLSLAVFAQTAKVVVLKPAEAAQAKKLHEALDAAKKDADDFDNEIAARYTWEESGFTVSNGAWHSTKVGWEYGFEFSEDFRFVVPKPYQAKAPMNCGMYINPAVFSGN